MFMAGFVAIPPFLNLFKPMINFGFMIQRKNLAVALLAFIAISQTACNQSAKTESSAQTETTGDSIDYRPQYHFSPPKGWINDPNGLIFANGQYHLFYQHNPFGNVWGHMSWGHAVSNDLLHWEDLPVAIPEFTNADSSSKTAIFSGSAVLDKDNKSGLCPDGTGDCMVAIYTGNVSKGDVQTNQYQNMAYSADKGRTWTQYAKNPIVDIGSKEFRDPNVFWYEPQQKWVMATVKATEHRVALYESKDLKDWQFMSYFGPVGDTTKVWECPALMTVPIEGGRASHPGEKRNGCCSSHRAIRKRSTWECSISWAISTANSLRSIPPIPNPLRMSTPGRWWIGVKIITRLFRSITGPPTRKIQS